MEEIKTLLNRILEAPDQVSVDRVFGTPREAQGRVLIPVAEISYGYGAGFGTAPGECDCACHEEAESEGAEAVGECECICDEPSGGGGGGVGGHARPLAYIEVGPEGTSVKPIIDEQKIALAGILLSAWAVGWIGLVLSTLFKD